MSFGTKMTSIANKIRTLLGISGAMGLDAMASNLETVNDEVSVQSALLSQAISALNNKVAGSGGNALNLQYDKRVSPRTSEYTAIPDSGYDAMSQVIVEAMPTATQATPSITVSSSGLITASAQQAAGYVTAGTKSANKQLTALGYKEYTPKATAQTILSGQYLTGNQKILGDSNLIPSNIRSGVSIFGIAGSYTGSTTGSSNNGVPNGFSAYESSEFSFSRDVDIDGYFSHSLGVKPNFFCFYAETDDYIGDDYVSFIVHVGVPQTNGKSYVYSFNESGVTRSTTSYVDSKEFYLSFDNCKFKGGVTYHYLVGVLDAIN